MTGRTLRLLTMERRAAAARHRDRRERDDDAIDGAQWWELDRAELERLQSEADRVWHDAKRAALWRLTG